MQSNSISFNRSICCEIIILIKSKHRLIGRWRKTDVLMRFIFLFERIQRAPQSVQNSNCSFQWSFKLSLQALNECLWRKKILIQNTCFTIVISPSIRFISNTYFYCYYLKRTTRTHACARLSVCDVNSFAAKYLQVSIQIMNKKSNRWRKTHDCFIVLFAMLNG